MPFVLCVIFSCEAVAISLAEVEIFLAISSDISPVVITLSISPCNSSELSFIFSSFEFIVSPRLIISAVSLVIVSANLDTAFLYSEIGVPISSYIVDLETAYILSSMALLTPIIAPISAATAVIAKPIGPSIAVRATPTGTTTTAIFFNASPKDIAPVFKSYIDERAVLKDAVTPAIVTPIFIIGDSPCIKAVNEAIAVLIPVVITVISPSKPPPATSNAVMTGSIAFFNAVNAPDSLAIIPSWSNNLTPANAANPATIPSIAGV